MRYMLFILFVITLGLNAKGQGRKYNMLIGYNVLTDQWTSAPKGKVYIDNTSINVTGEIRKMPFGAAQANISDENGNMLFYTNGCWIADATGDTMQNGSGLNPGPFANGWCDNVTGLPFPFSSLIIPMPADSNKYVLFHQTANVNIDYRASELFLTQIDLSMNSGLGGVDSIKKNSIVLQDTLSQGITACKHANGKDWWIISFKDSSDIVYKILLTDTGISSISPQQLNIPQPLVYQHSSQPTFSSDGSKFAYNYIHGYPTGNYYHEARLLDFDRCSGNFSNPFQINLTDSNPGLGVAFSPSGNFLYCSSTHHVFQINTNNLFVDTVATWDGSSSPFPPFYNSFWHMYLASNSKIYISTGSGTLNLHTINYPDSAGVSCDVQQHNIALPCYTLRANVNHPNYYLGCDTTSTCPCLATSLNEIEKQDFKFSISPNPSTGSIKVMYILPQNRGGTFQILDITGNQVFKSNLPQWSTLQNFNVENLSSGIYLCKITSDNFTVTKKLVVQKD